jgi:hypothetical protein
VLQAADETAATHFCRAKIRLRGKSDIESVNVVIGIPVVQNLAILPRGLLDVVEPSTEALEHRVNRCERVAAAPVKPSRSRDYHLTGLACSDKVHAESSDPSICFQATLRTL